MQQHSRPAWAEHHGHGARGRGNRFQVQQRLPRGLTCEAQWPIARDQLFERVASASTGVALLAATILLREHRDVESHEGAHVCCEITVAVRYENDFVNGGYARHHLHDARVELASLAIHALEPCDFLFVFHRRRSVDRQIEVVARLGFPRLHAPFATVYRNRAGCS